MRSEDCVVELLTKLTSFLSNPPSPLTPTQSKPTQSNHNHQGVLKANMNVATELVKSNPMGEDGSTQPPPRHTHVIHRPRASFSDSKFAKKRGATTMSSNPHTRLRNARNLARQASVKNTRAQQQRQSDPQQQQSSYGRSDGQQQQQQQQEEEQQQQQQQQTAETTTEQPQFSQ